MKKRTFALMILVIVLNCSCNNNRSIKFDHYGIFIVNNTETVELKGFQFEGMSDHFQGSDINNTISLEIKNVNEPIKIWVYSKSVTDEFSLLTDLKNSRGEYVCCFNCGSYDSNPSRACQTIDIVEKPTDKADYRLFEANITTGIYCFMNKENRIGYIFKVN